MSINHLSVQGNHHCNSNIHRVLSLSSETANKSAVILMADYGGFCDMVTSFLGTGLWLSSHYTQATEQPSEDNDFHSLLTRDRFEPTT